MADDAVLVVDGGDFVATASYIVRPRAPLSWLDPGVFGTLGVGGGFALGAALVRPGREVWLIWGDGSSAYTLAEFDTYVRHGVAPIALIGNDASWMQIAREQVEVLGTSLGTDLRRSDYHKVAEGYGGVGLVLTDPARVDATLAEAKAIAKSGRPGLHQHPLAAYRLPQGLDLDVSALGRLHTRAALEAFDVADYAVEVPPASTLVELEARDAVFGAALAEIDDAMTRVMRIELDHALADDTSIATPTRKVFARNDQRLRAEHRAARVARS